MGQGGSSFAKELYDDTIGGLVHGVERLFETGGGSAIYGPAAKNVGPFAPKPPPPTIPKPSITQVQQNAQQLPGQQAIQNSLNTANQYQARFGLAQHF
tara:strand:+ start:602 stop:895 length:294 start_codon:yes stop_codon:yes gene_type:complete